MKTPWVGQQVSGARGASSLKQAMERLALGQRRGAPPADLHRTLRHHRPRCATPLCTGCNVHAWRAATESRAPLDTAATMVDFFSRVLTRPFLGQTAARLLRGSRCGVLRRCNLLTATPPPSLFLTQLMADAREVTHAAGKKGLKEGTGRSRRAQISVQLRQQGREEALIKRRARGPELPEAADKADGDQTVPTLDSLSQYIAGEW